MIYGGNLQRKILNLMPLCQTNLTAFRMLRTARRVGFLLDQLPWMVLVTLTTYSVPREEPRLDNKETLRALSDIVATRLFWAGIRQIGRWLLASLRLLSTLGNIRTWVWSTTFVRIQAGDWRWTDTRMPDEVPVGYTLRSRVPVLHFLRLQLISFGVSGCSRG